MELPKVVIKDNYQEFLNGERVRASVIGTSQIVLQPGTRVMAFKDTIAATTNIPVPKPQQSHYMGVEGTVTEVDHSFGSSNIGNQIVHIKKL